MTEQKNTEKEKAQAEALDMGAKRPIATGVTTIGKMTVPHRKDLLADLGGSNLSHVNLNHWGRLMGKTGFQEIIEFSTGMPPETTIRPTICCWDVLQGIMTAKARDRGLRIHKVQLPPAWETQGLYRIQRLDIEKSSGAKITSVADLIITQNHSEKSAAIQIAGAVTGEYLHPYFPVTEIEIAEGGDITPRRKRKRSSPCAKGERLKSPSGSTKKSTAREGHQGEG
eukprot:2817627-Amphidinium_carterae.4